MKKNSRPAEGKCVSKPALALYIYEYIVRDIGNTDSPVLDSWQILLNLRRRNIRKIPSGLAGFCGKNKGTYFQILYYDI